MNTRVVEIGHIKLLHGGTVLVWKKVYDRGGRRHTNYFFDLNAKTFTVRHVRDLAAYGTFKPFNNRSKV